MAGPTGRWEVGSTLYTTNWKGSLGMDWNLIRRFGKSIADWPCNHNRHEWGLWSPGTAWWHRNCLHCDAPQMATSDPQRCDVDIPAYERYRERHAAFRSEYAKKGTNT